MHTTLQKFRHLFVLVLMLTVFLIPYLVFAQNVDPPNGISPAAEISTRSVFERTAGEAGFDTGPGQNSLGHVVANVINAFLAILGVIFLVLLIYGGYLWMTAQGNQDQVTKAKDLIRNSIIGLIIIIGAYAISYFIITAITGGGAPANNVTPG